MFYSSLKVGKFEIFLVSDKTGIKNIIFDKNKIKKSWVFSEEKNRLSLNKLKAYFKGDLKEFNVDFSLYGLEGTSFQKKSGKKYKKYHTEKHPHIKKSLKKSATLNQAELLVLLAIKTPYLL